MQIIMIIQKQKEIGEKDGVPQQGGEEDEEKREKRGKRRAAQGEVRLNDGQVGRHGWKEAAGRGGNKKRG